jgi:diguanylate cyclase (GGDEF)-like protein
MSTPVLRAAKSSDPTYVWNSMNLNRKITIFSAILAALMVLTLTLISLYAFRQYSMMTAQAQVRSAAEIVRVNLTEQMLHGVIDRREGFLGRLKEVEGFKLARVVRSDLVVHQYGKGSPGEVALDDIERKVMTEKQPAYVLSEIAGEAFFRGTIPYIATSHGIPNCMQCHQVHEGAVLGAVSITFSIDHLKRQALLSVVGILAVVVAFALLAWYLLRRLIAPIAATAHDVELAVELAQGGNFKSQVLPRTSDEVGNIAQNLNRLLQCLGNGLSQISDNVAHLVVRKPVDGENQLKTTVEMVEILVKVSHFKQAIEEDETRAEIHGRLVRILQNEFMIDEFSLYEVENGKNRMTPLLVDGVADAHCRWCNPEILIRSEACRALRTGHVVDAVTNPGICYAFQPPQDALERSHICLPIMQSGSVGNVLQIVAEKESEAMVSAIIPFINVYLREAAPVLESKRLMETLREANLRDPMTGLNNRRFLEEYLETLLAATQRRKAHMSILMLDLDFFKVVNDTHGHDAGDAVLKVLAKTLRQSVRASDFVIRFGGEEFLILLQDTRAEEGVQVAENIRVAVEKLKIPVSGGVVLQKTISIGVADFPDDSAAFWQALKFADVSLYHAKQNGRNRVVRFTPDLWSETQDY